MRPRCSLLVALLACSPPAETLVICHNANCAGSADPAHDDELDGLAASLALEEDGRPVVDGVELDTFWSRARARCLFAHDAGGAATAPPIEEAAALVAARTGGAPFYLFIELKDRVGPGQRHTEAELAAHAGCALAVAAQVPGASVVFDSAEPSLLAALVAHPRWGAAAGELAADFGAPADAGTRSLADFAGLPLSVVETHPDWTTRGRYEAYRSLGLDLCLWSYVVTRDTLDAITRRRPRFVLTGEAPLVRRWLDR